jgi:hypothetical protein
MATLHLSKLSYMKIFCFVFILMIALLACDDDSHYEVETPVHTLLKSYESTAGNMSSRATYDYDNDRRLTKITWQRSSPHLTTGSDVFYYDDEGQLVEKITSISGVDAETTKYHWDADKVFASATYVNGRKTSFQFFDYNQQDELEKIEHYSAQEGGFLRSDSTGLSYHSDGNLYKMLKYGYDAEKQRLVLLSTAIFDEYIPGRNPLAMVEILPVISLQSKLPAKYSDGSSSEPIVYSLRYQLRNDGYPTERIVTSLHGEERTTFTYSD